MSFWKIISNPFEDMWDGATDFVEDVADDAIGGISELGEDIVDVGAVIGDGIVAAAETVGEGVVTYGEGVAKWSVGAGGAVVDWSKTSADAVARWTEDAAGTVTAFSLATYEQARPFVLEAVSKIREGVQYLAGLFLKRNLPPLGPTDVRARNVLNNLLTGGVGDALSPLAGAGPADALAELARAMRATIGYEVRLTAGVMLTFGVYVDRDGQWGFYDGVGDTPVVIAAAFSDPRNLGGQITVTTVFGDRAAFSGRSVYVIGGKAKFGGITIGGDVLLSASPLGFLGFDVKFGLTARLTGHGYDPEPTKPKFALTRSDSADAAFEAAEDLGARSHLAAAAGRFSDSGASWDAAVRSSLDPDEAESVVQTALAAATTPFRPRYTGNIRTGDGSGRHIYSTRELSYLYGLLDTRIVTLLHELTPEQLTSPFIAPFAPLGGWRLVRGLLGDATCVSIEADLGQTHAYACVSASGNARLRGRAAAEVDDPGFEASFVLVRGLSGSGVSLQSRRDPAKYVVVTAENTLALAATDDSAVFRARATFLLDRPTTPRAAERATLDVGDILGGTNRTRRSGDGRHVLVLQDNGALAVYRGSGPDDLAALLWSSPGGASGPYHATVIDGCRLAVYQGAGASDRGALHWSTDAFGSPGATGFAAVTAAGHLAVFQGTVDRPGELVWSSRSGKVHWARERRPRVALRTHDGHYLTGGKSLLNADAIACGPHELFELVTLWNDQVALRAASGQYVCAEGGGGGAITVSREEIGPYETFDRVAQTTAAGAFALRAASGHYVCAENGGGTVVLANRNAIDIWERFVQVDIPADHGWTRVPLEVGGALTAAPAVGSTLGSMYVFYRGEDKAQYGKAMKGSTWQPAWRFDSHLLGSPAATSGPDNLEWVCHVGGNGKLHWCWNDHTNLDWHLWGTRDGRLRSSPCVATWDIWQKRDIFAQLQNGNLGQTHLGGDGLVDWIDLGRPANTTLHGTPTAVWSTPTRLDVFINDDNGGVWYRTMNLGSGWGPWQFLGHGFTSAPSATCPAQGKIWLFIRGDDNGLHHRRFENGNWGPWQRLGGSLASAPAATSRERAGGCDVFARARDGGLLWIYWTGTRWTHQL